jgi:putative endonuclease
MVKLWCVYILKCRDGTLYTGVTNDVEKRVVAHNTSPTGAKYTKARRPVVLVYTEEGFSQGEALSREAAIKKYTKATKLRLIKD